MLFEKGNRLVMIGDSITDCGRQQPQGEGRNDAAGNGYVNLVNAMITAKYPELGIRVTNMGTSGNTVRELKTRWEKDVLELHPDWVSIMIGINDVWRQFDLPLQKERHVYIDEYTKTLDELVAKTKPLVKGIILLSPYYIESNPQDSMRSAMDLYGKAMKETAEKYNTYFINTQDAFNRFLRYYHPNFLAWDRVHPNTTGHMILAMEFMKLCETA